MTWAIFSIVANKMAPLVVRRIHMPSIRTSLISRAPFFQLSEQMVDNATINGGTHPAYPFLTGHGGANQVSLFGYLGLRQLPDDILHVDPNLPPQIPYLKYRDFYWHGWPISAWSNYTHTTIRRAIGTPALDTADSKFANKTITIHSGPDLNVTVYQLPIKGAIVIPHDKWVQNTVAGNLVQCQPIISSRAHLSPASSLFL